MRFKKETLGDEDYLVMEGDRKGEFNTPYRLCKNGPPNPYIHMHLKRSPYFVDVGGLYCDFCPTSPTPLNQEILLAQLHFGALFY